MFLHSVSARVARAVLGLFVAALVPGTWGQADVQGQWGPVTNWPILPIHMTLMPTGKVLAWGHDATNNTTLGTIWDPNTNSFQTTSFGNADLFCAGHGLLPDGRVFVAGGHNMADYNGITNATLFDPTTLSWSSAAAMSFARWYPTVTALPDGRILVSSGAINCAGCNATVPEIYNTTTNSWTQLTSASLNIPIYPHMFVLPDGRVLNTGSYELPVVTRTLNISTQTWTTVDPTVLDGGSSVMYIPGKILKTGTSANSAPPYKSSAATAYVLDMTQGSPAWRTINSMGFPRTYHNLTSLPDGNVLVTGGEGTTNPFDQSTAVYAAEMWSPTSETFTTMASMQIARVYHSTALLLPDGRVLVGGGGENGDGSIDQLNAEIYSPPYLFKGTRPTVTSSPSVLQYGSQFAVQTPDAATISSMALLRLGSVTHAFNENQQYVPLAFAPSVGSLNVEAPANGNIAPPGYYMLFLVNSSGVPSVAKFAQLVTAPAPAVTSITPNSGTVNGGTGVTITGTGFLAGATVSFGGTAATGVTVVNSTSITATTPAHAAGAVAVVVINADSQSGTLANGYTYQVAPAPDFQFSATALSPAIVPASGSATSTISITSQNGFTGNVTLSCSSIVPVVTPPPTCSFSPSATVSGSGTSTLTVNTLGTTPTGDFSMTVAGTSGSLSHTALVSLTVSAAPPADFTIAASALSPPTVSAGGSAMSTITITSQNGLHSSVSLSCSSIAPAVSRPPTCSFSPVSVANGSGTSTLTVSTTAAQAFLGSPSRGIFYAMLLPIGGLAILGAGFASRRKKLLGPLMVFLMLAGVIFLATCGGSGSSSGGQGGTPAGTYSITVSATSGSLTHTTTLTPIVR